MVQIPGLLILTRKKKPPAKAVVKTVALAGFIKRSQFELNQRL
jgi:hypothetical protein